VGWCPGEIKVTGALIAHRNVPSKNRASRGFLLPEISSPSKTKIPETTKAAEAAFCFTSGLGVLHQD
jgi:hypothetical protein